MTYDAYEIREKYRSDPQIMERFIGKIATVGVYEEQEDSDGPGDTVLLMSVTGTVQTIAISTEGGYTEVVVFEGLSDPVSNRSEPDKYFLIISGDVS